MGLRLHDWRAALKPRGINGFERFVLLRALYGQRRFHHEGHEGSVVGWLDDQAAIASLPFSKAKA